MRVNTILLGIFLFLMGCNSSAKHQNSPNNTIISNDSSDFAIEDLLVNTSIDTSIVYSINDECVFVIQTTTAECDSLEKIDSDLYEQISENANNFASDLLELLEKYKINNYWSDRRYIEYTLGDKKYLIDTRKKALAMDYCLIFKKGIKPKLILTELLDEETLKEQFKK